MAFASALSEHPVPAVAIGEVAGQILERLGPAPDLAVLFVTPPHAGALEDAAAAVADILRPASVIGCAAVSVVGKGREVEEQAAVSLWAGRFGDVEPVRLEAVPGAAGIELTGFPHQLPFEPRALLLMADPFSFPIDALYAEVAARYPGLPVVGGNASAAHGPGGNRLVLDRRVHTAGAVGAFLGPGVKVETVVSQGCRPVGRPYVVTRSERNLVQELGGDTALGRLLQMTRTDISEADVNLINQGLHLGRVINESKLDFDRGDFLVHNVLGADQATGAIAVNDVIEVGTTVQFHV
ncbi:MAG: FIST N-terminal domain-containing protein, partial [Acidimicrobiales bacterium]